MRADTLASLFDTVVRASAEGRAGEAADAFHRIVGLAPRREFTEVPTPEPMPRAPLLRYGEPRRIDLIALAGGARDVAKFEDLTEQRAAALEADLQSRGFRTVRAGPYTKRFDVTVAEDRPAADLFTVVASRGTEADAVVEAERDRSSDGTRVAGLALGYPACCVEHFVETERASQANGESINEAAIRSIAGVDEPWPWETNILSSLSPVGFIPCRTTCPRAMGFATRVLASIERADPNGLRTVRDVLRRPVLFLRYSLFWALDGEPVPGPGRIVRYTRAFANDDGSGLAPAIRAFQDDELGAMLASGNEVELDAESLTVRNHGALVASWQVTDPGVPRLFRFRETDARVGGGAPPATPTVG